MIEGDFGLVEGELWWMDQAQAVFWCAEILESGAVHGARIDLGVRGQTVDIVCTVQKLFPRGESRVKRGYVLESSYKIRRSEDENLLYDRLKHINPEFAKAIRSSGKASTQAAPASQSRASAPKPASTGPKGDPVVMVSPGRTPSVFIQFSSPKAVGECLELVPAGAEVTISALNELSTGDPVLAVLQLPGGVFIQTSGTAERLAQRRMKITLDKLDARQRRQLTMALK